MMDNILVIAESDLASRRSAAKQRDCLVGLLENHATAAVDLSSVESLSESYADELFAVLIEEWGADTFFQRVFIKGAKPAVIRSIAQAISHRFEDRAQKKLPIVTLAAKKALEQKHRFKRAS